jgi:hypothetical protein
MAVKGEPKSVITWLGISKWCRVLDELDCFCYTVLHEWLVFDPLGRFVDCNEDVLKSTFGLFEWSYLIQPSAYEWPGRRDAN